MLHSDEPLLGQADRGALRTAQAVHTANSNHLNHTVQTHRLHGYLRWRNANARHPDELAAQRKERVRTGSEKGIRWGGRQLANSA